MVRVTERLFKIKNNITFDSKSLYFGGSEKSDEMKDSKHRAETMGIFLKCSGKKQ